MTIDELKKVPFRETCHKAMGEYIEALKQRIELECDFINNKKD